MAKKSKKKVLTSEIELEKTKPKKKAPKDRAFELLGKKMEQQNK